MYRSDCSSLTSFSRTRQRCTCAISHANYSHRNGLEGERRAANLRARRDLITVDHCEKHHQPPKNNRDCIIELCSGYGRPQKTKKNSEQRTKLFNIFLELLHHRFRSASRVWALSFRRFSSSAAISSCDCLVWVPRHGQFISIVSPPANFSFSRIHQFHTIVPISAAAAAARVQTKQNWSCF